MCLEVHRKYQLPFLAVKQMFPIVMLDEELLTGFKLVFSEAPLYFVFHFRACLPNKANFSSCFVPLFVVICYISKTASDGNCFLHSTRQKQALGNLLGRPRLFDRENFPVDPI